MDYQYRYWYQNSWQNGALRPRYQSVCEERCREELRRLEDGFNREMSNLQYFYYSPDDFYRRAEYDATGYYYKQRDRIIEYWRQQEQFEQRDYYYGRGYRDYLQTFNNPIYYNLTCTLSNPTPLLLENKSMPTEKKKYIVINNTDEDNAQFRDYETLAEAETAAKDLARESEGEEFIIFESKKSFKIAGPPLEEKVYV